MSSMTLQVSYIKAIDVWLSGCMSFLVAAMLEYAVVSTLVQRFERHKQRRLCANGGEQACGKDKVRTDLQLLDKCQIVRP